MTKPRYIRNESGKRAWVRAAEAPGSELVELLDDWAILVEVRTGALYAVAV
jgi:hypothetical protein